MFSYSLPPHLIAHAPAEPRDSSRLLQWPARVETPFSELPTLLKPNDLLVLNTSQVIPARLFASRPARAPGQPPVQIELLLHRPLNPNLTEWQTYVRPAKKLKDGDVLTLPGAVTATVVRIGAPSAIGSTGAHAGAAKEPFWHLHLHNLLDSKQVSTYLNTHGHTPLPPYIKAEDSDFIRKRYQTVYANQPGSVAAPTAGLHFTSQIIEKLKQNGVNIAHVTLHVGAGTFQNPTPEQLLSGKLHAEYTELPPETAELINKTKALGGSVIAVGTTALRTLETWGQQGKPIQGFKGETTIFIRPGYTFQVVDKLITNFHLPESSLLMLVEAFIGNISELYQHAIEKEFRFYSFGDTSILTRKDS